MRLISLFCTTVFGVGLLFMSTVALAEETTEKVAVSPDESLDMVSFPEGSFLMGLADVEPQPYGGPWKVNELPARTIHLTSFELQRHEVTVGQWIDFLQKVAGLMAWHPLQPIDYVDGQFIAVGSTSMPIRAVTWQDAQAFCRWHGMDLPTEAQWERAARGSEENARTYPWGEDAPSCGFTNISQTYTRCHEGPVEVGAKGPLGDTPEGVQDLGGNVSEWVRDYYGPYNGAAATGEDPTGPEEGVYKGIRGGSYLSSDTRTRTTARDYAPADSRSPAQGFRCVKE